MRFNPLYPLDTSQVLDMRGLPPQEPVLMRQQRMMPSRRIADMRRLSPPNAPAHQVIRRFAANPYPNSTPHAASHHFHIPLPNLFPDSHPAHLPMAPPDNTTTTVEIAPHLRAMAQWLNRHHPRR